MVGRRQRGLKEDKVSSTGWREPLFKQSLRMAEAKGVAREENGPFSWLQMSSAAIRQAVCCDSAIA